MPGSGILVGFLLGDKMRMGRFGELWAGWDDGGRVWDVFFVFFFFSFFVVYSSFLCFLFFNKNKN